jgi:hypothetical protein
MSIPVDSNLDLQSANKVVNVPTPTSAGDAAPKSYVDAMALGVIFLQAVRVAVANPNVSITAPGASLDGQALAAGDRVLLADQTTTSQNGIWVWNGAAAAMTRPGDFASGSTHHPGTTVFVEQGSANANALFSLITTADITVDATSETWSQTNGTTDILAGAGLTKTGNTLALSTPVSVANGGTGGGTVAAARTTFGFAIRYQVAITGDGATTSFTITHNLGFQGVAVSVMDETTLNQEMVAVTCTSSNVVTLTFGSAPASGDVKLVTVIG